MADYINATCLRSHSNFNTNCVCVSSIWKLDTPRPDLFECDRSSVDCFPEYDQFMTIFMSDNFPFNDQHGLTNSLWPLLTPQVSLLLLLPSLSTYKNTAATARFLKYLSGHHPVGEGNTAWYKMKSDFLIKILFLISIHICLLFSTCTLAKQGTCYFWSMFHIDLSAQNAFLNVFVQAILLSRRSIA